MLGRTPGEPTGLHGRDHYQFAYAVLAAGAGIQGGRPIGKTDEIGPSKVGIDWTKSVKTTPSGREFFYVEPLAATTNPKFALKTSCILMETYPRQTVFKQAGGCKQTQ